LSVKLDRQNERRQLTTTEPAAGQQQQPQPQASDDELTAAADELADISVLKNIQEGNDIYLTCQVNANPRPLKPIVWRFNGRQLAATASPVAPPINQHQQAGQQQQQQQGTIVINNNSLVLRKVSRHQSGAYTCEASNQLGANTSRPFELVIRHAPVCKTDDM
jgi:hypothetical protein